jgi:hypothetical protein
MAEQRDRSRHQSARQAVGTSDSYPRQRVPMKGSARSSRPSPKGT